MLLETIKSLVLRSKKRKELLLQPQPLIDIPQNPKPEADSAQAIPSCSFRNHAGPDNGLGARSLGQCAVKLFAPSFIVYRATFAIHANFQLLPQRTKLYNQQPNHDPSGYQLW